MKRRSNILSMGRRHFVRGREEKRDVRRDPCKLNESKKPFEGFKSKTNRIERI